MRDANGNDVQHVVYHSSAWAALVEQGYVTHSTFWKGSADHQVQWAVMLKERGK
jgi:hypothetical protein